jgi:hypothetical protein
MNGELVVSKRHHNTTQEKPQVGKKALEREQRQQAARQKMRLHKFTALALLMLDKWQTNEALKEDIASLPANERRYIKMQVAKCRKATRTVIRMLHEQKKFPSPNNAFFLDAMSILNDLLHRICYAPSTPETCRHIDVHSVLTYLVYAALYEWRLKESDGREKQKDINHMIGSLGALGNHLIPFDSPMAKTLNDVFWETRDTLHSGAALPQYKTAT